MEEELDIFRVVKGSGVTGGFGSLFDISWFAGIDTFEDAQSPEIWEGDLQFTDSLSSRDIVFCLASCSFLLNLPHCECWRD
jgi:hypothetical protein